jgi:NAD+ diphosphatase
MSNPNAFSATPLDRAGHLRRDAAWLEKALQDDTQTVMIPFHKGKPLMFESGPGMFIRYLAAHTYKDLGDPEQPLLFLGIDRNQDPHFAFEIADPSTIADYGVFGELRAAGPRLAPDQLSELGTARAVLDWHARNRFCANCGAPTRAVEAGWKRHCEGCQAEHFPRVDPVVIMVPVFREKCLLGRQKAWPRGMYSALAGFIEPGETIEAAVARETLEEAGLVVTDVRLHSTQPWPFPHSLMIGALCDVSGDAEKVDEEELESARWFTREEARALIAGTHGECFAPPAFAIAHQLLKTWSEG